MTNPVSDFRDEKARRRFCALLDGSAADILLAFVGGMRSDLLLQRVSVSDAMGLVDRMLHVLAPASPSASR